MSFNATTPVSNDRTRSAMPELRPTVEAGISLDFHLWQSADARAKWDLRIPLRSAFAIESPPQAIGWTFSPAFALDLVDHVGYDAWKLGLLSGPLFANAAINSYSIGRSSVWRLLRARVSSFRGYAGSEFLTAVSSASRSIGWEPSCAMTAWRPRHSRTALWSGEITTGPRVSASPGHPLILATGCSSRLTGKEPTEATASNAAPAQNRVRILRALHLAGAARTHMPSPGRCSRSRCTTLCQANLPPGSAGAASMHGFRLYAWSLSMTRSYRLDLSPSTRCATGRR